MRLSEASPFPVSVCNGIRAREYCIFGRKERNCILIAVISQLAALEAQIHTTGFNGLWKPLLQTLIRVSYLIRSFGRGLGKELGGNEHPNVYSEGLIIKAS